MRSVACSGSWADIEGKSVQIGTHQRHEHLHERFVMALGFGPTAMEAGQHALISLLEDFDVHRGISILTRIRKVRDQSSQASMLGSEGRRSSRTFLLPWRRGPFAPHLVEPFHVDGRFLPRLLVWQRFQQLDGVCEVVLDRLP